jgi:hypothetical protein
MTPTNIISKSIRKSKRANSNPTSTKRKNHEIAH